MKLIVPHSTFAISLTALLLAGNTAIQAKPATKTTQAKAQKTSAAKPATKPAASPKSTPAAPKASAVLINATTRNRSESDVTLQLARDGKALLPIVISAKASDSTKAVAKELAEYLSRIAGATFEVKSGDGASGIVLGSLADFPTPALSKALEIVNGYDGKEAFAIRTRENKVLLLGATDLGASHAAFRFLDELGVRWFWPNKAWEVVPSTPDLKWNRDITDRPSMLSRVIWFEAGSGTSNAEKEYQTWKRHNLQAESFKANTGHNLFSVPAMFPEEFKAHPEYYAVDKDGKRLGDDIELTNPAVRKLIVEYVRRSFKQWPDADMISIDPTDTAVHSQRPEALKIPYSDQIFGVANEVARMLQKEFPGKMVGLLSYNAHYDPPSFNMEPNVHIQLTSMSVNPKYSGPERAKIWAQRSSSLGVYEYYSVFLWANDNLPGSYTNGVRESQRHIRDELVGRNIVAMSAESTSSWGSNSRGYYFANKLMWNPNIDLDAELADYYDKAFGPAARAMEKYYEHLSPDNNPLMSAHLLGLAFKDIDEATKAAKDRPDVLARIDQIKLYLRFVDLQWRAWNDGVKVPEDAVRLNAYRTREYALTSWEMARQTWWASKDWSGAEFQKPYTHEEIEADFQDGLKYYEPRIRDIGPRFKYSTNLVPVQWPDKPTAPVTDRSQTYQGSMKYALYSLHGEPLEFTTEAGDAWGYRTSYTVTGVSGKVIAEGKPEPKVLMKHKIEVPAPGLYYLNYNDPGAYWTFNAKPDQIASIVVLPEFTGGRTAKVLQDMYFYVPKGTKKLEYFTVNKHWVIGPDGSEQQRVEQTNEYISVPVPDGMDGKVWRLRNLDLGKIYFNNAPSYFATSPDSLLVPREVAEKDGLQIRK
jgi:hypothetical protein